MENAAKLRRLNELRCSLPHMSQVALAAFLSKAQTEDLPVVRCRNAVRRARDAAVNHDTPVGLLIVQVSLELRSGGTKLYDVANPHALLYLAASCKMFSAELKRAYNKDPCGPTRPWKLCVYCDEAKPGNAFKQDNKRSLQNVYAGIMNLGAAALAKEDFWLTLATLESTVVAKVEGGMSQVIGAILKLAFDLHGYNLERAGLEVVLHDGTRLRIFLKLACLLCDESGLHQVWMCKGASGTKCCVECMYIVNPNWVAADEVGEDDDLVLFTKVFDVRKLVRHTKHTIHAIVDNLASAKPVLNADDFKAKEQTSSSGVFSYANRPHDISD